MAADGTAQLKPSPAPDGGGTSAPKRTLLGGMLHRDAPALPGTDDRSLRFGLIVVVSSVIWGLATYLILTGLTPIVPRGPTVAIMVSVNIILIVAMIAMILVQVRGLWQAWKDKVPGARLHGLVVALFSVIAMLPAVTLATGATVTFARALDTWFGRETRAIIENSMEVASAYLEEHGQLIRSDVTNMAKDLDDAAPLIGNDQRKFRELLFSQAGLRDLPVAYVIDAKGNVKLAALENDKIPYERPPLALITATENGQVPLLMPSDRFRVAALAKLSRHPDSYVYVARGVSPKVVRHYWAAQQGVANYEELRRLRGNLKFIHGLMYFMMALTALSTAIWTGLWFAGSLVAPIRRLIDAAQSVARGNLDVALPINRGEGDLRRLSQNFNHMTQQIARQRNELVTANVQLSERRRFMEAVLSAVSAGVIGLDPTGRVTLVSRSAEKLLGRQGADLVGQRLVDVVPEFAPLLQLTDTQLQKGPQTEVMITIAGEDRTFATRLTRERQGSSDFGSVLTFDDVTDLVVAQRTSAWAEIARRLAHEIKNPLTPIQLSAERIRRKYSNVIKDDREVFDKCTETIIRQVGDVSRMVDEFSSFARMPKPEMVDMDVRDAVRDPVTLYQMSGSGIEVVSVMPKQPVRLMGDRRLLSQALTNLVKNATESVQSVLDSPERPEGFKGRVEVVARQEGDSIVLEVIDNGLGMPKQNRARLLEPYVTTKGAKGTGLGLAIVQKITESHGGTLELEDAPPAPGRARGALVRITIPIARAGPDQQRQTAAAGLT